MKILYAIFFLLIPRITQATTTNLVDITKINSNITLDIRYATKNNFLKKVLYSSPKCYLKKHVAKKLALIQKELETMGLGLKIFDGYRPFFVQKIMYESCKQKGFVARPNKKRAKHPRGTAVDLTLVDKNGKELEMPTEFDTFSPLASRARRKGISKKALENREFLESIMVKYGFIPLACEWWHFDYYDWKSHAVINKDFSEIEKEQ